VAASSARHCSMDSLHPLDLGSGRAALGAIQKYFASGDAAKWVKPVVKKARGYSVKARVRPLLPVIYGSPPALSTGLYHHYKSPEQISTHSTER
jgi:hypothetical protein